jgi:hypothetical protein
MITIDCISLTLCRPGKGILGRVLCSSLGGRAIYIERRDVFGSHTFDHIADSSTVTDEDIAVASPSSIRVCLDVASLDLPALFQAQAPPAAGVLVCAKHLCGLGTDLALDCIERARGWSHLRGILIAPCCHQTINWDALPESFRHWFLDRGFQSSWWTLLKLLVHSSKSGTINKHFGSFGALSDVSPLRVHALGRLARRCIEEARCHRLNTLGFSTRIFRYCPAGVSPDNLVIIAQRASMPLPQNLCIPSAICSRNAPNTPAGVILRLESCERSSSVVSRLYSSRGHLSQTNANVLFDVAWEQTLYLRKEAFANQEVAHSPHPRDYELVVVINCASLPPLLAYLGSDRVLRCSIRQIIPFCHQSSSTAVLQRHARSIVSNFSCDEKSFANDDDAVRLLCWPPSLLEELKFAASTAASPPSAEVVSSAAAAASAFALKLHPTQYKAALCAVEWLSVDCSSDEVSCDKVRHSYGQHFVEIEDAHRLAVESQQLQYEDPSTGWKYVVDCCILFLSFWSLIQFCRVFSQLSSSSRGYCCGMACRHCIFGHENVDPERRSFVKAPITINGARRSIFWTVLSQDEVSQLLLPAATFCSDSERSFERLSEVVELNLLEISGSHVAVVRDEIVNVASLEPQLTLEFLQQRGAVCVSHFVFQGGRLVFVGTNDFGVGLAPASISLVISHSKVLSRTVSDKCDTVSRKHGCTDLVRVFAQFSSYSHLALATGCTVMYRVSLSPTLNCFKDTDKKHTLVSAIAMCAGELSQRIDAKTVIWGFDTKKIFHALSDRKFERTVVAKFVARIAAPPDLCEADVDANDPAILLQ